MRPNITYNIVIVRKLNLKKNTRTIHGEIASLV